MDWGVRRFHNNICMFPNPTEFGTSQAPYYQQSIHTSVFINSLFTVRAEQQVRLLSVPCCVHVVQLPPPNQVRVTPENAYTVKHVARHTPL